MILVVVKGERKHNSGNPLPLPAHRRNAVANASKNAAITREAKKYDKGHKRGVQMTGRAGRHHNATTIVIVVVTRT